MGNAVTNRTGNVDNIDNADNTTLVTGMVLEAAPAGEYDKRIVLLTREHGRITAFVRRARRQGSPLMAAATPFAFGKFRVRAGRSAYNIIEADIDTYFETLRTDVDAAMYGMYFLEVCNEITREENDESRILLLLYASCRALERSVEMRDIPYEVIRRVFEIRTVVEEGEFPGITDADRAAMSETACYAIKRAATSPLGKLYSFALSGNVLHEVSSYTDRLCHTFFGGKTFRTLQILGRMRQM